MRAAGEVVGLIAVVGSLIFVGLEIRQNAEATRAAAVAEVTGAWFDFHSELGADPAVQAAIRRVTLLEDFSEADPVDASVVSSFTRAMFVNWANAHYHYDSGLLEPEFWAANRAGFEGQISGTGPFSALLRRNWAGMRHAYPPSFVQMIDSIVTAAELR